MEAENLDIRRRKIYIFAGVYFLLLLILSFFLYWIFIKIPTVYNDYKALKENELLGFLANSNEVEQIVDQIQNKSSIKQQSMIEYYSWMNLLKEKYPRPYSLAVLDSYLMRVKEIEETHSKDTSLIALQEKYQSLRAEIADLSSKNTDLELALERKKQTRTQP